jgi:glycerophosphoryl diester phosphodiesterase
MVAVIAHRGSGVGVTENTLKGMQTAVNWRVDGIEFDVRRSQDDHLVIIHDETLNRTTNGTGLVDVFPLSELKRLDAGEGEQIPTLAEVFELLKSEMNLTLHVEIKTKNIEAKVVEVIREQNLIDRVVVSSFLPSVLETIHQLKADVTTAYLYHHDDTPILTAQRLGCSGLHPLFASVTEDLVRNAHRSALFVNPWTVDFEEEMHWLIALEVDGIITNNPPLLQNLLTKGG